MQSAVPIFGRTSPGRRAMLVVFGALLSILACGAGCGATNTTPRIIYLDGAGWFGSHRSVQRGLRAGGYTGAIETFSWGSLLGPGADHFVAAPSRIPAKRLARRIEELREHEPDGKIHLMGLSAGTAVVVRALEELEPDIQVDHVVLLSPSVSSRHNLAAALEHVHGRLYATGSKLDPILGSLLVTADGRLGPPAGRSGFVLSPTLPEQDKRQYAKVVNLPWQPSYAGFGCFGWHTETTSPRYIQAVIAPRILSDEPFPLDRPLAFIETQAGATTAPAP
jgi:pimeloyl-ACP methyl ester carboxylesterase